MRKLLQARRQHTARETHSKRSIVAQKIGIYSKYYGIRLLIGFINTSSKTGKLIAKHSSPSIRFLGRQTRKIFLGGILNIYFIFLKGKKRSRLLLDAGRYKIWSILNRYIYRITIIVLILVTIGVNFSSRNISAEELHSNILLSSIVEEVGESIPELIEEGPLDGNLVLESATYVDSNTVISDEFIESSFSPDSDDDDVYATTEGDSAIIAPIITDPEAAFVGKRTNIESYTVESGDTISTIARKFSLSTNTILWENSLSYNSTIRPGQKLTILPTSGVSHTVKSGETVSSIASKYQAQITDVVLQNRLADAGDIHAGEKLVIPDGIKPSAVASVPRSVRSLPSAIKDIFVPSSPTDSGSKLLWPVGSSRMTQYYHYGHSGIDVGDKMGSPIFASESGRVERSGWTRGYGYNIIVNHGNGIKTLYAHASRLLVNVGDTVARGETIALVGSSGWSTGPHIHFEVIVNGRKVNPFNYTN